MAMLFALTDATATPVGLETRLATAAAGKPRACGRTRRREARFVGVSGPLKEGRVVSPLLADPLLCVSPPFLSPPLQQQRETAEDKQQYYVNMGHAIRTLREDFPVIFYREPSFDIYRHDIVFKDPVNTFVGIDNYKHILWALRFNGRIFFKALWIDIVSVWQPVDNVIMIRWIVHGIPRVPCQSHGRFDGTSRYKLDDNGKIFEHHVDNVAISSPPKLQVLAVEDLIQFLGCPSTPRATYFESALARLQTCIPLVIRFTLVKYYLAFYLILTWQCATDGREKTLGSRQFHSS